MAEPLYFEGYEQAIAAVGAMNEQQLLAQIDALYGRSRLGDPYTLVELKIEAVRQTKLDWLNPQNSNYNMVMRILMQ